MYRTNYRLDSIEKRISELEDRSEKNYLNVTETKQNTKKILK